jgi:hypothetical protein
MAALPRVRKPTAYGRGSQPVFSRLGGRIVWRGKLEQTLIGPSDEFWDICFVAEYPSVAAFAEMVRVVAALLAMTRVNADSVP